MCEGEDEHVLPKFLRVSFCFVAATPDAQGAQASPPHNASPFAHTLYIDRFVQSLLSLPLTQIIDSRAAAYIKRCSSHLLRRRRGVREGLRPQQAIADTPAHLAHRPDDCRRGRHLLQQVGHREERAVVAVDDRIKGLVVLCRVGALVDKADGEEAVVRHVARGVDVGHAVAKLQDGAAVLVLAEEGRRGRIGILLGEEVMGGEGETDLGVESPA